jgi:hypothetical protein
MLTLKTTGRFQKDYKNVSGGMKVGRIGRFEMRVSSG